MLFLSRQVHFTPVFKSEINLQGQQRGVQYPGLFWSPKWDFESLLRLRAGRLFGMVMMVAYVFEWKYVYFDPKSGVLDRTPFETLSGKDFGSIFVYLFIFK